MESITPPHSSHGNPLNNPNSNSNSNSNSNTSPTSSTRPSNQIVTNTSPPAAQNSDPNANESPITSPTITSPSSIISPPYWQQSHTRSISHISIDSIHPSGITLQDNTADGDEDDANVNGRGKNEACWARSVVIEDYVVVNGSGIGGIGGIAGKGLGKGLGIGGGIGAFVVWNVKVDTLEGTPIIIRKRYSEFADLRTKLLRTFPNSAGTIPELPRKSVISKFRPKFLENRRSGLQYFLKWVLYITQSRIYELARSKGISILLSRASNRSRLTRSRQGNILSSYIERGERRGVELD
ncbi:putative intermediate filament protein [Botrytis fragariae]|uniref:Putative intermediate filament protein n=1 Tax=Botrytis fragariae TaxID=1964551 RepID=A0A8H6AR19_9HELO|nr:putative intermediate filament protein [Botrytis fragariae]KAF5872031.1 putative intermediate filament protein [Botrytis fragariae]